MQGVQRCGLIEDYQPARRRATVPEYVRHDLVLHHIARYQGPVRFDKRQLIPFGMRAAEPEETRHHTAQVDLRLGIERNIKCAERGVLPVAPSVSPSGWQTCPPFLCRAVPFPV